MASHHYHQCHCSPTPTPSTTTCYCTICYTTTHYPPPPSNPLIHPVSSHHHHHQIHQHAPPQNHHNNQHAPQQNHHLFQETPPPPINPTVSSLIHRIAALETSLRRRKHSPPSSPLRDAAARTIQTHFRAFLVRRSVTLRQLKRLTHIKSNLNHLKSSISNKTQFDFSTLYRESMNLLIKLESLQGSDPMIRDGKRSISRELIRFMELIDEMCRERKVIAVKNVQFGDKSVILQKASGSRVFGYNERKLPENLKILRRYMNKVGESLDVEGKSEPKVKKNVSFYEDGNVYRMFKSKHNKGSSDGSDGDDVEVEEIGVCSKETEVVEDDESSEMSENEMDPRKNLRTRILKNQPDQEDDDNVDDEDDSFVFSAPLPAKMEY